MKKTKVKDVEFTEVKHEETVEPEVVEETVENVEQEVVEETVENVEPEATPKVEQPVIELVPATINIDKCARLNARKEASKDAEVVRIIDKTVLFNVNITESTEDFYKVEFLDRPLSGYCLKEFIVLK